MAEGITRRPVQPRVARRRADGSAARIRPAGVVNPARPHDKVFAFSFSSGRHPLMRKLMEEGEAILARTLYRPFMHFVPPVVDQVTVPVAGLPPALAGMTIAQLSDIHHSQLVPLSVIEQAVALTNSLKPDVVCLTGDYVTNDLTYASDCARTLAGLSAPYGVYAILGNHDYWTGPAEVALQLRQNGITVLINEACRLAEGLWVAGMDDIWSGKPDLDKTLRGIPSEAETILLVHEPDYADQAQGRGVVLQVSGHSHGGQVRLPFTKRPILPLFSWKYYTGLQEVGDHWVYTNRGLGTMQPPFIFNCRPEVALLRLEAG